MEEDIQGRYRQIATKAYSLMTCTARRPMFRIKAAAEGKPRGRIFLADPPSLFSVLTTLPLTTNFPRPFIMSA